MTRRLERHLSFPIVGHSHQDADAHESLTGLAALVAPHSV